MTVLGGEILRQVLGDPGQFQQTQKRRLRFTLRKLRNYLDPRSLWQARSWFTHDHAISDYAIECHGISCKRSRSGM